MMDASSAHSEHKTARPGTLLNRLVHRGSGNSEGDLDHVRTAFGHELEHELERSSRGGRPLSVLMGALAAMPQVPEQAAVSAAGDALRVVAAVAVAEKRRIDSGALIDDNRFALILPDTGERGAFLLAQRLLAAIAQRLAVEGERPAVSFGIASFPRHGRGGAALIGAADRALRAAQSLGGDRAVLESVEAPATIVSVGRGDVHGDLRLEALLALTETVDIRDHDSPGHSQTVGRYAEQMARELGMPVRRADRVRVAGILHDLGKVTISEHILGKPSALDDDEWRLVRAHAATGAEMVDSPDLADVREWVLAHHERPDGTGYPRGLSAREIPLEARIIAVADAYEAMTTDRTYRPALTHAAAQEQLIEGAGAQFDQRVVHAFLRLLEREGLRSRSTLAPRS